MAASTTPPTTEAGGAPHFAVAVAYSGGRDSTALLHATARLAAAGEWGLGAQVLALHVHHGLSPLADDWWAHTQAQCARWRLDGLPVVWEGARIQGKPGKGESVEAWARQARYEALASMARRAGVQGVMLAHHRQDQAETFLLQALRGAGVAGLACMPNIVERDGIQWLRPWLTRASSELQAYVDAHGLAHIEDDSNVDTRFARNRLRLKLWPLLESAFPGAADRLTQSASHAADANACLQDWLRQCLPQVTRDAVGAVGSLSLPAWQALGPAQQRMVLMAWVQQVCGQSLTQGMVARLQAEWQTPRRSGLRWPLPAGGELRLHRSLVRFEQQGPASPNEHVSTKASVVAKETAAPSWPCTIRRAGRCTLPDGMGVIQVQRVSEGGLPLACLSRAVWRKRTGGEQFQLALDRPARSLKKQFQQAGLSSWDRAAPLLWLDEQLLFVPGLGVDARAVAMPGGARVDLTWLRG